MLLHIFLMVVLSSLHCCNEEPILPDNNNNDTIPDSQTATYRNPLYVPLADEIADPSVYRYKNQYYLLSTQMYSRNGEGMTVWSSKDLVNWEVHKKVLISGSVEPILAPELVYHEGSYFLYWSVYPGEVHYAAKYTPDPEDFDPFGPSANYEIFSYNYLNLKNGIDIDGEMFFDQNDLYMFYCGLGGIQYKKVTSLSESGNNNPVQLTACAVNNVNILPGEVGTNGWTEAPGIFYDDGYYYLTYSGVHYLRSDYQIHSARGQSIEDIAPYKQNPLIAKFDGLYNGMGNNNFTIGPDLTTKYLTYHAKVGAGIHDPTIQIDRRLMIDTYVVSSENGIVTKAPTLSDEPVPQNIGWENTLDSVPQNMTLTGNNEATIRLTSGSVILSTEGANSVDLFTDTVTSNSFVIEGNTRGLSIFNGGNSKYGMTICDGKVKFAIVHGNNSDSMATLEYFTEDSGWTNTGIQNINYYAWHKLRLDKKDHLIKFYYDDRYICQISLSVNDGGKAGYYTEDARADISWIGFSDY
ncbi:MAG: family 43 glycosylhydrolase [Bacteroidales bacterium]|nr:family 43 glycosylhydrolase [Bacteroidales bacterium]